MKIERMHVTASNAELRSARKLKTEKHQILADDAVTFDADRRKQQQQSEESALPQSEEKELGSTAAAASGSNSRKGTEALDIVV